MILIFIIHATTTAIVTTITGAIHGVLTHPGTIIIILLLTVIYTPKTVIAYNHPRVFNLNTYNGTQLTNGNYTNPKGNSLNNSYNYGSRPVRIVGYNPSSNNSSNNNSSSGAGNFLRNIFNGSGFSNNNSSSTNSSNSSSRVPAVLEV